MTKAYADHIEAHLQGSLLDRFHQVPHTTIGAMVDAMHNVDNDRIRYALTEKRKKNILMSNMMRLLSDTNAMHTLREMPPHIKIQLSIFRSTPSSAKKVRKQYMGLALKNRLLLQASKHTDVLSRGLGISHEALEDHLQEKMENLSARKGWKKFKQQRECAVQQLSPEQKEIVDNCITCDHIESLKTFGEEDATKLAKDPMFFDMLFTANTHTNLYIMPHWLNSAKNMFVSPQIRQKQKDHLFFNLVPIKGPEEGEIIYPDAESFRPGFDLRCSRSAQPIAIMS